MPFGALVTLAGNETNTGAGITGDGGEVYMSGLPLTGRLLVSLGNKRPCIADYRLPEEKNSAGIYAFRAVCR
ncbi:FimD/PapC C-terminal domain-containing protein [Kosakonia oryzae]|uniref:FimD/PapC C-terminal domain-containing protein n=1 Tax=Kosakonia oryzae TaxID=497725 RepID=UPI001FC982CA|nr:FimD/PapC C-terminal domain-containing protein [Kosakonia oryzae]